MSRRVPRRRLTVHGLDEEAADSYTHPALAAEHHIQRRLTLQTLSTDAAIEAAPACLPQPYHD